MTAAPRRAGVRRTRDSAASRRALLDAAGALFDERGFEGATTREIGARAGVDPALIARYFASKEGLYLAVLEDPERAGTVLLAGADLETCLRYMLARWSVRGSSPVASAMVASDLPPEVSERLGRILGLRIIEPLVQALADADAPGDLKAKAQLAVALVLGIAAGRSHGALPGLSAMADEDLVALLTAMLLGQAAEAPRPGGRRGARREPAR